VSIVTMVRFEGLLWRTELGEDLRQSVGLDETGSKDGHSAPADLPRSLSANILADVGNLR
jgi:hypothetical protein